MSLTQQQFKDLPALERIILCWLEPNFRACNWTLYSGNIYYKVLENYAVGVMQENTSNNTSPYTLTEVASLGAVVEQSFYFKPDEMKLYVWLKNGTNPNNIKTIVTVRIFLSNSSINLSHSLVDGGTTVPYEPIIQDISSFKEELDENNTGNLLESSGSLTLHNDSFQYFSTIWDNYNWKDQKCYIWLFSRQMNLADKFLIFKGLIVGKSGSFTEIQFDLKNEISFLKQKIDTSLLPFYSSADGTITTEQEKIAKRLIFGYCEGVRFVNCDQVIIKLTNGDTTKTRSIPLLSGSSWTGYYGEVDPEEDWPVHGWEYLSSNYQSQIESTTGTIANTIVQNDNIYVVKADTTLPEVQYSVVTLRKQGYEYQQLFGGDTVDFYKTAGQNYLEIDFSDRTFEDYDFDPEMLPTNSFVGIKTKQGNPKHNGIYKVVGHGVESIIIDYPITNNSEDTWDVKVDALEIVAVEPITSTKTITLSAALDEDLISQQIYYSNERPVQTNNRKWQIAGQPLYEFSTTITYIDPARLQLTLTNAQNLRTSDEIITGGFTYKVMGISGNIININTTLDPSILVGATITRTPLRQVYILEKLPSEEGEEEKYQTRVIDKANYTLTNSSTLGAYITFNSTVEEKVFSRKKINQVYFRVGSRLIMSSGRFKDVSPRDKIYVTSQDKYYVVEEYISDNFLILTEVYDGAEVTTQEVYLIQPQYLNPESVVCGDCYGITFDNGDPVSKPSDVIKYFLDFLNIDVDTTSFTSIRNQTIGDVSLVLPQQWDETYKVEVKKNKVESDPRIDYNTVFSLINNTLLGFTCYIDGKIGYRLIEFNKNDYKTILTDQIIDYSLIVDETQCYNEIPVNYSFRDVNTIEAAIQGEPTYYIVTDPDINLYKTQKLQSPELNLYIARETATETLKGVDAIVNRYLQYKKLGSTVVTIRTKMEHCDIEVGDTVLVYFDSLTHYQRYQLAETTMWGIVTGINKTNAEVVLTICDYGQVMTRLNAVATNSTNEFYSATDDELRSYMFITDNNGLLNDNNSGMNTII